MSEDDGEGSSGSSNRIKEETSSLIQKQFAMRKQMKIISAKEMEMLPSTKISKVKCASSTSVKVSGLTNQIREKYLTAYADLLKINLLECGTGDPPMHDLIYRDFEDIGIEVEYECFTNSTGLIVYRQKLGKEVRLFILMSFKLRSGLCKKKFY